jgi:hypothetical protein
LLFYGILFGIPVCTSSVVVWDYIEMGIKEIIHTKTRWDMRTVPIEGPAPMQVADPERKEAAEEGIVGRLQAKYNEELEAFLLQPEMLQLGAEMYSLIDKIRAFASNLDTENASIISRIEEIKKRSKEEQASFQRAASRYSRQYGTPLMKGFRALYTVGLGKVAERIHPIWIWQERYESTKEELESLERELNILEKKRFEEKRMLEEERKTKGCQIQQRIEGWVIEDKDRMFAYVIRNPHRRQNVFASFCDGAEGNDRESLILQLNREFRLLTWKGESKTENKTNGNGKKREKPAIYEERKGYRTTC